MQQVVSEKESAVQQLEMMKVQHETLKQSYRTMLSNGAVGSAVEVGEMQR